MKKEEKIVKSLLGEAGVTVNGRAPYDIQIKNPKFYKRVLNQGSLGLGEAYMDGWWDSAVLDELFNRLLLANIEEKAGENLSMVIHGLSAALFNLQSKSRAFIIGKRHYDIGNDLYKVMLDRRMTYTCGYWKDADNLDEAQEAKLDLVCRKIGLKKGQKILDIGCGWGSFAKFAAEKYGAEVVGITVSEEQVKLGKKLCEGLPVEIRLQDYRDVDEKFDHIVSLGMFEHVGPKNYKTYMKTAARLLKDDGLFLLHTIGGNKSVISFEPWIEKYIFPGGLIPSIKQIAKSVEGLFVVEDWHNFGADYDKTLMAWHKNFEENWSKIKDNYSDRFYRMWRYYLLSCAGGFRARKNQLWQIVLSKNGVPGGYDSIR
ncbi:MAG: cyclopropane fatty acyl phospholipid synthase [bacterium]|nr:cyclopropane fatty acyl phospholipid synthase [bacterium]